MSAAQISKLRLWHNPRCSKSRQALEVLTVAGHQPEIYLYLKDPPDAAALKTVLAKLDLPVAALVRTGQAEWKATGLGMASHEADICAAILAAPILIERPILETDRKAIIGRPPEAVLTLLT